MVQRMVPNKIGIKTHHHKSDNRLFNLRPSSSSSSSQSHEKMKKIMKKSRSVKRSVELVPPFKTKKPHELTTDEPGSTSGTLQKQSPNYMKSTSSFAARKEQSPKTPTSKGSRISITKNQSASGVKGSRTSSFKTMRSLTKTPSFKPSRCSKKVILCEDVDVDVRRPTCSSTLKKSKFPNYLQLDPGGTELDGTSATKVCPYTYCSLNGIHHAPVPPLKCFLSAKRCALKSQKGFKLGCLSPCQIKLNITKLDVAEPVVSAPEDENTLLFDGDQDLDCSDMDLSESFKLGCFSPRETKLNNTKFDFAELKEKKTEFFVRDQELECSGMDWEEGYCSDSVLKLKEINEDGIVKTSVQLLYDEESVSSGAWSDEDSDCVSGSSFEKMKIKQDFGDYDSFEESNMNDELQGSIGDDKNYYQNSQTKETFQESKTVPDYAEKVEETDKNHTTIIYNITQFNISLFVFGEKTEHLKTDKTDTMKTPETFVAGDKLKIDKIMAELGMNDNEAMEDPGMSDNEVNQIVADEDLPFTELTMIEKHGNPEQEFNDYSELNSMDEEHAIISAVTAEMTSETDDSFDTKSESCVNFRGCKKPKEETGDDSMEFNPRGPNFLPEIPDPDAETVDLRHQMMDERKNAKEWMVDFALQQAVTTLAPARNRKVALLVEAFEKVIPPDPVRHNRHISKAFTNSRPMQACS